jgi:hypothetical protein
MLEVTLIPSDSNIDAAAGLWLAHSQFPAFFQSKSFATYGNKSFAVASVSTAGETVETVETEGVSGSEKQIHEYHWKKKKMLYSLSLSTSLSLATDESSKVSSALETFDHPLPLPEVDKTVEIELPDGESIKRSSFSEVASLDFDSFSDYTYTKKQKKQRQRLL